MAKSLSAFASLSILARVIQMLTALVIVRSLDKQDYGWYCLANNLQGTLALFSVTGVATGLMALSGEAIHDRFRLGSVLSSAAQLRSQLMLVGSVCAVPVYGILLLHTGCPHIQVALLSAAALLTLAISIANQMMVTPFQLAGLYHTPQVEVAATSFIRLIGSALLVVAGAARSVSLMFVTVVTSLPMLWGYLLPRSRAHVEWGQPPDPQITRRLHSHFLNGLPTNLTYLFEAQIASFFVAWLGGPTQMADLGALSRVALILAIPTSIISGVLTPRMARETNLDKLWKMWLGSSAIGGATAIVTFIAGVFFRKQLLWLLGSGYTGLGKELVLFLGFQAFAFAGTVIATPTNSRGWIRHSWIRPFLVFGLQAVAIPFLDLKSVTGAIGLMWAGSIGNTIMHAFLLWNGWRGKGTV